MSALPLEPGAEHRVGGMSRPQDLERIRTREPGVGGLVDVAHPASSEHVEDAVSRDQVPPYLVHDVLTDTPPFRADA